MIRCFYAKKKKQSYMLIPMMTDYTYLKPYHSSEHHLHPVYHMVFIKRGTVSVVMDKSTVLLSEGDILIIQPMEKHIFLTDYRDVYYYAFNFILVPYTNNEELLFRFFEDEKLEQESMSFEEILSMSECESLDKIFNLCIEQSKIVYDKEKWANICDDIVCFHSMNKASIKHFRLNRDHKQLFSNYLNSVNDLFYRLYYKYFNIERYSLKSTFAEGDVLIKKIKIYLEKQVQEKLSLNSLSTETGYNKSYISSYFKQKMNMTITTYFNNLKIQAACEYLRYTNKSITEISYLLGYSSSQHFSRAFKKEKNYAPKDYRNNIEVY